MASISEGDTAGITNVGIFGEGTDTPSLDAVAILAPRQSPTDVIQIVGRCMRRSPEKTTGYVIVPVPLPRGLDAETSLGMTELGEEWKPLSQILTALRAHDGRIEDRIHDLLDIYVPTDERSEIERAIVAVDGYVVRTGVWKGPTDSSPEEVIRRVKPPAWRERTGRGRIQLMVQLGRETPELPGDLLFSDGELRVLATFARSRTLPAPTRLGDAVGLVARLGGWLGRKRDPPGAQLLWHGYTQLVAMAFAFELRDEFG